MTQPVPLPKTLLELAGRKATPPAIAEVVLVLIDCQNEYVEGQLALSGIARPLGRIGVLLHAARAAGSPIIHVAHKGSSNGQFDRSLHRGAFIAQVAPLDGETIVEKPRPNAFSDTTLQEVLGPTSRPLIIVGFMTHMCISSTARAALDLGYPVFIAADAVGTRDLPDGRGGVVTAAEIDRVELAALADRFAGIFPVEKFVGS